MKWLPKVELDVFPEVQSDPRKEAIRRELMSDVARIKIYGMACISAALVIYLLTESVAAYMAAGLLGAAGIHILAFVWARPYFEAAEARRQARRAGLILTPGQARRQARARARTSW